MLYQHKSNCVMFVIQLLFAVIHVTDATVFDFTAPHHFASIEDILKSTDDISLDHAYRQKAIPQMKNYVGSIRSIAVKFNHTIPRQQSSNTASHLMEIYNAMQNSDSVNLRYGKKAIRKSDTIRSFSGSLLSK